MKSITISSNLYCTVVFVAVGYLLLIRYDKNYN